MCTGRQRYLDRLLPTFNHPHLDSISQTETFIKWSCHHHMDRCYPCSVHMPSVLTISGMPGWAYFQYQNLNHCLMTIPAKDHSAYAHGKLQELSDNWPWEFSVNDWQQLVNKYPSSLISQVRELRGACSILSPQNSLASWSSNCSPLYWLSYFSVLFSYSCIYVLWVHLLHKLLIVESLRFDSEEPT